MFQCLRPLAAQAPRGSRMMMATVVAAAISAANGHAQVVNGDFSQPAVKRLELLAQSQVKGWKTTDSKGQIEIWPDGYVDGGYVFKAPSGIKQFAEVNANSHGKLSQEVAGIQAGNQYGFSFWHRGRHSDTEADTIEVTVTDAGKEVWKRTFSTTRAAWKQYTVNVGVKTSGGPVVLAFASKATASKNDSVGNFLTGVRLDSSVVPPPCVANAVGDYQWTTDNRQTTKGNGKLENVGVVKLTADQKAVNNNSLKGVWQITNDCQVTIDWENGRYFDRLTLTKDGKQMTGTNQIGTIITGKKQ